MGWGDTNPDSWSPVLLEVTVPVIPNHDCEVAYEKSGDAHCITRNDMCAGIEEGGKGSCYGDSGGPAVFYDEYNKPYQIGVVSWAGGDGCVEPGFPDVFARVTTYLDWIEGIIGKIQLLK